MSIGRAWLLLTCALVVACAVGLGLGLVERGPNWLAGLITFVAFLASGLPATVQENLDSPASGVLVCLPLLPLLYAGVVVALERRRNGSR